jgi:hypothetical protein
VLPFVNSGLPGRRHFEQAVDALPCAPTAEFPWDLALAATEA